MPIESSAFHSFYRILEPGCQTEQYSIIVILLCIAIHIHSQYLQSVVLLGTRNPRGTQIFCKSKNSCYVTGDLEVNQFTLNSRLIQWTWHTLVENSPSGIIMNRSHKFSGIPWNGKILESDREIIFELCDNFFMFSVTLLPPTLLSLLWNQGWQLLFDIFAIKMSY